MHYTIASSAGFAASGAGFAACRTELYTVYIAQWFAYGFAELPSSTELPYFIRKSVINTEVRIPVIKYGNMKIQTCVYIAATVANILHALRASFNS